MHNYVVAQNKKITPSTLLITLQHRQGEVISFEPGQYAAINGYRGKRPMPIRCFSLVSSPTDKGILQFSMRVKGRFTNALSSLKEGDDVHVQGPYGGFVLNTARDKGIVLLAGGIGITPFISMIRYAAAVKSDTNLNLLYSIASEDDMPFAHEIQYFEQQNPNFNATFVVSDGVVDKLKNAQTASGRLNDEIIQSAIGKQYGDAETVFYICGPPAFMKGMLKLLRDMGIPKARIMTEAFSQGPNRQTGKVRDWPFSMYTLTAIGVSAATVGVMVSDFIKVIPPHTSFKPTKNLQEAALTNNRQLDIDALVNSLPAGTVINPESDSVKAATAAATPKTAETVAATQTTLRIIKTTTATASTSTNSTSSPTSNTTTPTQATTSTTPSNTGGTTTTPKQTCTTSASGVTTCV